MTEPIEDLETQLRKRLIIIHVDDDTGEVHLDEECRYSPTELIGWAAYLDAKGRYELEEYFERKDEEDGD